MEIPFPPPHMVLFEPLNDVETSRIWKDYTSKHSDDLDIFVMDAAKVYSVEEFSKQFETWITAKSSKRIRVLMVWHAHFLSLACQQVLRRWLETKSYRSRVWFHVELLNSVQPAILSRCILREIRGDVREIPNVQVFGEGNSQTMWSKRIKELVSSK
jgi:hypothetical protein